MRVDDRNVGRWGRGAVLVSVAIAVDAAQLVLVTGVAGVYTDFESPHRQLLQRTSPETLETLAAKGEFPPGSMGPKVEAAVHFVRSTGRPAVICQPADLAAALAGQAGTRVQQE